MDKSFTTYSDRKVDWTAAAWGKREGNTEQVAVLNNADPKSVIVVDQFNSTDRATDTNLP